MSPKILRIRLTKHQHEFLTSEQPTVILQGGAGSGKTYAGVLKALINASNMPESRGMFVAPSYSQLQQAAMPHLLDLLQKLDLPVYWQKAKNLLEFSNKSQLWLRSADNPATLLGADLAWAVGDEVALWQKEAYDYLMGRIRQPNFKHQVAFTFTPKGHNWAFEMLGIDRPGHHIIRCSTLDNVFLDADYYERLREEYGEDSLLWRQEVLGEFVTWKGLVYNNFNDQVHVRSVPSNLSIVGAVGGVDWGWTNPGVLLVVLQDTDDVLWVVEEVYEYEKSLEWWIDKALEMTRKHGVKCWFADPSEPGNIAEMQVNGVNCARANNAVIPGISAVSSRLSSGRLFISPTCTNLISEMHTYSWKEDRSGGIKGDEPLKVHDHAVDALRYAVTGSISQTRLAIWI